MPCSRRLFLVLHLLPGPGQPPGRSVPHCFRQSCDALSLPSVARPRADENPILLFYLQLVNSCSWLAGSRGDLACARLHGRHLRRGARIHENDESLLTDPGRTADDCCQSRHRRSAITALLLWLQEKCTLVSHSPLLYPAPSFRGAVVYVHSPSDSAALQ